LMMVSSVIRERQWVGVVDLYLACEFKW
jgi:hypothetical protein